MGHEVHGLADRSTAAAAAAACGLVGCDLDVGEQTQVLLDCHTSICDGAEGLQIGGGALGGRDGRWGATGMESNSQCRVGLCSVVRGVFSARPRARPNARPCGCRMRCPMLAVSVARNRSVVSACA